jgi:benzoate membrane transport protein
VLDIFMPSNNSISAQAIIAGSLAGIVGFSSSFVIVLHGLQASGASSAEATSGIMALSVAMGLGGIGLSAFSRMPISVAWSTPGAALLTTTGYIEGGFAGAVGAFLLSSILLIFAGIFKPLGRAVSAIPAPLANAMLAGILLHLCLAPVHAVAEKPWIGLFIILVWAITARLKRLLAVPAALVSVLIVIGLTKGGGSFQAIEFFAPPILVLPVFSLSAFLSVAFPLFLVTMASQNIPGIAVLAVNGYKPEPGPLFTVTGVLSLLSNPFGGHAVNLAAITAAMCAGPDAHTDIKRRYWAGIASGLVYIVFGIFAGAATSIIGISPPIYIEAVAGLALIGAFSMALFAALSDSEFREAAAMTFLVSASGLVIFNVGSAFWGLIAGGFILMLRYKGRSA